MRVFHRKKWDVTHSLTPSIGQMLSPKKQILIPQIPVRPFPKNKIEHHYSVNASARSRKHRLVEQRNTQIQKNNRMLYQKIRKIMQKGHSSEKKVQPTTEEQINAETAEQQFLNTSIKPFSLPHINTTKQAMKTTQSQLSHILDDRSKYAQKYFAELLLQKQKLKNIHSQEIGNFRCFGWKVNVLLLNHGQFLVLKGKKGKKQTTKKYIYEKVKAKVQKSLQEWVNAKFQFEI